jgi:hypothetical protein
MGSAAYWGRGGFGVRSGWRDAFARKLGMTVEIQLWRDVDDVQ